MSFNPKWIVGKRVVAVEMGTYRCDDTRQTLHDPKIVFEDGSCIRFVVEEHFDGGEYGVDILYVRGNRK